jgi:hypothetical protein
MHSESNPDDVKVLCQVTQSQKLTARRAVEADLLYELVVLAMCQRDKKVMPDDHSEVVPLLPIPNRTVKRLCADDSAGSRVKVGHRQALTATKPQQKCWGFCFLGA